MIPLDVIQGTEEWFIARMGIPTASCFGKIITGTGKASTSAEGYRRELLAEWKLGRPLEGFKSEWMDRGNELEEEARNYYGFMVRPVEQGKFCYLDERKLIGCSPDAMGLEIKCPKASTQVDYLLKGKMPTKYIPQVQGCMWITESDQWDFLAYHPELESLIVTVKRDDKYIATMSHLVESFVDKMMEARECLTRLSA